MKQYIHIFEEHIYDAVFRVSKSNPPKNIDEIKSAIRSSPYFKEFVSYGFNFTLYNNGIIVSLLTGDTEPLTPEAKLYSESNNGEWVAIKINLTHNSIICNTVARDLAFNLVGERVITYDGDGDMLVGDELDLFTMKGYGVDTFNSNETDLVKRYIRLFEVFKDILDRMLWYLNKDGHFRPIKSTENLGQTQVDRRLSDTINDLW